MRSRALLAVLMVAPALAGCLSDSGDADFGPVLPREGAPVDAAPVSDDACRERTLTNWSLRVFPAGGEGPPGSAIPFDVTMTPREPSQPAPAALRATHWARADAADEDGLVHVPPEGGTFRFRALVGPDGGGNVRLLEGSRPQRVDGPERRVADAGVTALAPEPLTRDADAPRGLLARERAGGGLEVTYRLDDPGAECSLVENPRGSAWLVEHANGTREVVIAVQWTLTDACALGAPPKGVRVVLPPDRPLPHLVSAFDAADACFCTAAHQPTGWRTARLALTE